MPKEVSHFAQEIKAVEHNPLEQVGELKLLHAVDTKVEDEEALTNQQEARELQNCNCGPKTISKKLQ